MNHRTFTFTQNKQDFYAYEWTPDDPPKAVICLAHGHGDYAGRYAHVAEFFTVKGFATLAFDNYGHGETVSKRGHFPSYDVVLDAMDKLVAKAKEHYPSVPIFLYGHSTGGNFVANYLLKRKPDIKGAIITSPWFRLAFSPSSTDLFLAKLMINIYPSFTQASKLDVNLISRDPAEVKKYSNDPLVHSMISPVFFSGVHKAGLWALEHAGELNYPVLLMHGTGDKVTSWEASKEFAEKAGDKVTLKLWEGLYHETHNEPEKADVMGFAAKWVLDELER